MDYDELANLFIRAADDGNIKLMQYCLEEGVNINVYNDCAIRYAVRLGELDVVKFLVDNGSNIYVYDNDVLLWACGYRYSKIVNYLRELDHGKNWNCYDCIIKASCFEVCNGINKCHKKN